MVFCPQTLTPYMQSAATKSSSAKKVYGRKHSSVDQEQGNFSIDLWKRAFKDACERLCPLRAGGHACGCLPVIARLVHLTLDISLSSVLVGWTYQYSVLYIFLDLNSWSVMQSYN